MLLLSCMVGLVQQFAGADLVVEILPYLLPCAAAEMVHLLFLKHAVPLFLGEESLKILHQALDGLVREFFSACNILFAISIVVRLVVPLGGK